MLKALIASFFLLVVAAPTLAKPKDVYPISCNDLWAAVKDTLENPSNYGILVMDDLAQRASFLVVGNLTKYTDRVALAAADTGCELKAAFLQVGSDDWIGVNSTIASRSRWPSCRRPSPSRRKSWPASRNAARTAGGGLSRFELWKAGCPPSAASSRAEPIPRVRAYSHNATRS